jgi:gas vesicle protein
MSVSKFAAGALCGLVAGLLIAPERGEDLRNDIADKATKWKGKLDKLTGKTEADLDDLKAFLDKNIDGLTDDVKHRILTILNDASDMAYNAKNHLSTGVI